MSQQAQDSRIQAYLDNIGFHEETMDDVIAKGLLQPAIAEAPDLEAAHAQDDQPLPWHAAAFEWVLFDPWRALAYASIVAAMLCVGIVCARAWMSA